MNFLTQFLLLAVLFQYIQYKDSQVLGILMLDAMLYHRIKE